LPGLLSITTTRLLQTRGAGGPQDDCAAESLAGNRDHPKAGGYRIIVEEAQGDMQARYLPAALQTKWRRFTALVLPRGVFPLSESRGSAGGRMRHRFYFLPVGLAARPRWGFARRRRNSAQVATRPLGTDCRLFGVRSPRGPHAMAYRQKGLGIRPAVRFTFLLQRSQSHEQRQGRQDTMRLRLSSTWIEPRQGRAPQTRTETQEHVTNFARRRCGSTVTVGGSHQGSAAPAQPNKLDVPDRKILVRGKTQPDCASAPSDVGESGLAVRLQNTQTEEWQWVFPAAGAKYHSPAAAFLSTTLFRVIPLTGRVKSSSAASPLGCGNRRSPERRWNPLRSGTLSLPPRFSGKTINGVTPITTIAGATDSTGGGTVAPCRARTVYPTRR